MNYVLHYISADGPAPDATWSVYREEYAHVDDADPIEGLTRWVNRHPDETSADTEARRLQEGSR